MPPQPFGPGFWGDIEDFLTRPVVAVSLLLLVYFVIVGLTGWIASRKGRDDGLWAFLALITGPFALLAVLVVPRSVKDTTEPPPPIPSNDARGGWGEGVK